MAILNARRRFAIAIGIFLASWHIHAQDHATFPTQTLNALPNLNGRSWMADSDSQNAGAGMTSDKSGSARVLLYFWATWCPDCREKLVEHLPKIRSETGVPVVTIATDRDADKIKAFGDRVGVVLPILWDPDKLIRGPLKIVSVPSWAVVKRTADQTRWEIIKSGVAGTPEDMVEALRAGL